MGKGGKAGENGRRTVTIEEVNHHNKRDDKWIVINGKAYDITNFAKRHPGGAKVISHYAGEDASTTIYDHIRRQEAVKPTIPNTMDAWTAFHNDKDFVSKHLTSLYVGDVVDYKPSSVQADFRQLRKVVENNGWLKPDPKFFALHLAHVIALELLSVWVLWQYGTGWVPLSAAALLFVTAQAQAGWTQHDYGHQSVFEATATNHWAHHLTIGFIKGASSHWWNFRHFLHHAKPNKLAVDPDIKMAYLFLMGDELPREWGKAKKGFMPYQFQHKYFFMLGPPLLLPLYFHYEVIYFCIRRRDYLDLFLAVAFFARLYAFFSPFLGNWGTVAFYLVCRLVESHWFVWCTQMSHLPMDIKRDQHDQDWFTMQLKTSCNVRPSPFTDWFTGHLNYQIEHHLFPTMPRHNFYKVAPLVQSLCAKHGIKYHLKSLLGAWGDVVRSLQKSGEIWYEAYYG